jgi:hypothetical protein
VILLPGLRGSNWPSTPVGWPQLVDPDGGRMSAGVEDIDSDSEASNKMRCKWLFC